MASGHQVVPQGEATGLERIDTFDALDNNNDGVISRDEWDAAHPTLRPAHPGSAARPQHDGPRAVVDVLLHTSPPRRLSRRTTPVSRTRRRSSLPRTASAPIRIRPYHAVRQAPGARAAG